MAEVLGKTNLFLCCNQQNNTSSSNISVFSKSCGGCCSVKCYFPCVKLKSEGLRLSASLNSDFYGNRVVFGDNMGLENKRVSSKSSFCAQALQTGLIGKAQKWWEKGLQSNMKEVTSAQELVDSLSNAGDKLVVVDFFSPGCGGCKALHPKICQLAEMNPDVQFLQIKKFKDALAKHTTDRCSLGPAKGLEEKELLALAANKDLNFNYTPKPGPVPIPAQEEIAVAEVASSHSNSNLRLSPYSIPLKSAQDTEKKTLVTAGR